MPSFIVQQDEVGLRLDMFLTNKVEGVSRSRIQKLVKAGGIRIDGVIVENSGFKLGLNNNVEFEELQEKEDNLKANHNIELEIVFEDEDLLVINKQAGLTVHPGAGEFNDTLVNALIAKYGDNLSDVNGQERRGILHRLDRDTGGLMLVAKNNQAHEILAEQIQDREVERIYHALVWNSPDLNFGKIETNIGRHPKDRKKQAVLKASGKKAITHYKLLKSYFDDALSLVECRLETGRTHQIRVHFEHLKMPLVGDQTYKGNPNQKKRSSFEPAIFKMLNDFPRQILHSKYIAFYHPKSQERLEFEVDYPKDIKKILDILPQ